MKKFIKITSLLLFLCMIFALTACSTPNQPVDPPAPPASSEPVTPVELESPATPLSSGTRIVTDMSGQDVEVPQEVRAIINLWHANNQVVLLLGGADKLVGTTQMIKDLPWFSHVYPRIADVQAYALQSGSGNFNTEEILAADPDVVITSSADDAGVLRNAGITTVMTMFYDFDGLKECVRVTAQTLGGDAPARAEEFCAYFDGNLKLLSDRLSSLSDDEKIKVYEIRSQNPLQTDGKISICTQWVEAAGGVNVAAQMTDDNSSEVVLEEIIAADPEVIIVATQNAQPVIDQIKNDPAWSSIKAIQEDRIYANPVGTFLWSRYSCEEALQVLWMAKTLHPDKFTDLDMVQTVRDFYKQFYDFDMTEENAELMLQGLDPQ